MTKITTAREVIAAVMLEVQAVAKNDRNEAQRFNFRGIDAVVNKVGPALRNAGGFIVPNVLDAQYETLPSRNGGSMSVARLTVSYAVYGPEGEPISGTVFAEAFDSGDKATAKAMSVAFRTFLLQVLALPTDEPDPDASTYEIAAKVSVAKNEWQEVIDAANTRDELLALYSDAAAAKAPKAVLDRITAKGKTLAD
jgi:hypothetical protein